MADNPRVPAPRGDLNVAPRRVTTTVFPRLRPYDPGEQAGLTLIQEAVQKQRRAEEASTWSNQPRNFADEAAHGLFTGLHRHPLIGIALDHTAVALGVPPSALAQLDEQLKNESNIHQAGRVIGEWGPELAIGWSLAGLGARLGVSALRAAALGRTVQGTGRMANQLNLVRARMALDSTQLALDAGIAAAGGTRTAAGLQALHAGAQVANKYLPTPIIERVAQSLGANAAVSGYVGMSEFARGHDVRTSLQHAALAAGVGLGFDLGIAGTAKALFGRAKALPQAHDISPEARVQLKDEIQRLTYLEGPGQVGASKLSLVDLHQQRNKWTTLLARVNALPNTDPNKIHLERHILSALGLNAAELGHRRASLAALKQIVDEPSEILSTTSKPYFPKDLRTSIAATLVKVGITPDGIAGKFGPTGRRLFSALRWADMKQVTDATQLRVEVEGLKASVMRALGYSPGSRTPIESGLLMRLLHEWEPDTATPASMARFLAQPSWTNEAGTTVKLGVTDPHRAKAIWDAFEEGARLHTGTQGRVHRVGGLPPLRADELARFGVRAYWPHLMAPGNTDDTFFQTLEQVLGPQEATKAWSQAQNYRMVPTAQQGTAQRLGPVRDVATRVGNFGTYDYRRMVPGTAWEKFTGKIPRLGHRGGPVQPAVDRTAALPLNADPFDALYLSLQAGVKRYYVASLFGYKGELIDVFAKAVGAEARAAAETAGAGVVGPGLTSESQLDQIGGNTTTFIKNLMDDIVDHKYYDEWKIRAARVATSVNTASKLTLGALMNLTQWQNTVYAAGWAETFKGLWELLRNPRMRKALQVSLAIPQHTIRGMSGPLDTGIVSSGTERVAEWLMKYTAFTSTEAGERYLAGSTGNAVARDLIVRAGEGRLRGNRLGWAHRLLSDLHINLEHEVTRYRQLGPQRYFSDVGTLDMLEGAQFFMAQRTQFVPSKLNKPLLWNHPLGRVMAQFKTFALGQARLLKDTILTEAAHGNMRPLAYFMALAPLSAEFVIEMKDMLKPNKTRDPRADSQIMRVVERASMVGGFGLAGDIYQAAVHGNLRGLFLGPTFDTVERLTQGAFKLLQEGDADQITDTLGRFPVVYTSYQLLQAGAGGVQATQQLVNEYLDGASGSGQVTVPLKSAFSVTTRAKVREQRVPERAGVQSLMDEARRRKAQ